MNQFKKRIEREKSKVTHEFDSVKREIIHNIEDLKLSVHAELDRVYKIFMEKYAIFKG
jgi:1-aminocyclopropane-1-carboxylate deaminase/D-cysteine desulfhydrase-like pyridoxal-dependent ACC family enzyme